MRRVLAICLFVWVVFLSQPLHASDKKETKQQIAALLQGFEEKAPETPEDIEKILIALPAAENIGDINSQAELLLFTYAYYFSQYDFKNCRPYINKGEVLLPFVSDKELLAELYYQLSDYYLINAEYGQSIEYAYQAKELFQELKSPKEYLVYDLLAQYALVYHEYQKAIDYYLIAIRYFESVNDIERIASMSNNMAYPYQQMERYDSAEFYYHQAIRINKRLKKHSYLGRNYLGMGIYYYGIGNAEQSNYYSRLAIALGDSLQDEEIVVKPYYVMGLTAQQEGDYRRSILYFNLSDLKLTEPSMFDLRAEIYNGLSESYARLGLYDSAFFFYKKRTEVNDSIMRIENVEMLDQQEAKYALQLQLREHQLRNRIQFFVAIIIFLSTIILSYVLYLLYKAQKRKVTSIKSEKKILESELEKKDRELATNMINMIHANEKKIQITKKLLESKDKLSKDNQKMIDQIIEELDDDQLKNIWEEFEMRFNQVNSHFYETLFKHHPDLTKNEKRLCAFIYLDLTTKEISSITFQSQRAIEVARVRLRKKLNLTNTNASITPYLQNLST